MATEIVDYLFYLHYLTAATHSDNKYSYLSTYGYLLLKYPLFFSFPELYIYCICIYKLPFFIRFVASLQYPPACYLFRACKTMANCGEDCEYSLTGGQPFLPQANCGDDCEYSLTGGQPFLTKVTYGDDSEYSLTGGQPFLQYCTYDQLWG